MEYPWIKVLEQYTYTYASFHKSEKTSVEF